MKTYLIGYENDGAAVHALSDMVDTVRAHGGDAHFSLSFGHGPAFIVLSLPSSVTPESVLPAGSPAAKLVEEVAATLAAEATAQPQEEEAQPEPQSQDFGGEFEM